MDFTTPTSVSTGSNNASAQRTAKPRTTIAKRGASFYLAVCGLLGVTLFVGVTIGVLVMRQRHRTQDIIVSANGSIINREDFFRRLQSVSGSAVMHQMLNEELMLQYAKQQHVYPSEAQMKAEYDKINQETLKQALVFQSPEDIKRSIRVSLIETNLLSKDVTVTPQEIQAFYQAQSDRRNPNAHYYTPESATIAVIVTATEAQAKAAEHDLVNGLPFATVAKNRSVDGSKQSGGVLPSIRRGQTQGKAPDLEAAIFSMKIGQQIGPRKFVNAWWIIRCLDKTAESVQSFAAVSEECRRGALLLKGLPKNGQPSAKEFNEFKKKAAISAFWPSYVEAAQKR